MVAFSPRNRFDENGVATGLACDESYCCGDLDPCFARSRAGDTLDWPSIFYVVGLDCNGVTEQCANVIDDFGTDCDEFNAALCPSSNATQHPMYAKPASGDVTHWESNDTSTNTGGPLFELEEVAGTWYLYIGGKVGAVATYTSAETPHRFRLNHVSMSSYFNCPSPAKLCADFTLQSASTDCQGWPDHIVVFGCFCEATAVCRICHDCDWDDTAEDECCVFAWGVDQWSGSCTPPPGPTPGGVLSLLLQSPSGVFDDSGTEYPSCVWIASGGSGVGVWSARLILYYNKATDQYRVHYDVYNTVFSTLLWEGKSSWFARERCHQISALRLNRLDGSSTCSWVDVSAGDDTNCPSGGAGGAMGASFLQQDCKPEMRRGKPVIQKGKRRR